MLKVTGGNNLIDVNLILTKSDIHEGMRVADLGCGATGHFVFPTALLTGRKGKVYAVDILKTVLETVEKRRKQEGLENVESVWSDLEVFGATKIESNSLDLAFLINTLYLSDKKYEMMREAVRLLKNGSRLLVVEWKNTALPLGPSIENRVKEDFIKTSAKNLGLQLVDEFEAGPYHYGMIFEKL